MAEGGFDPCECIWNHERAMDRLLNLLRSSQGYCDDNQCIQEFPGPTGDPTADGFGTMTIIMVAWILLATVLFLVRPASLRSQPDAKPRPATGDRNGGNPPPAPLM